MTSQEGYIDLELPPLLHVGIVVTDIDSAARDFERRWGARVTDVEDMTLHGALYDDRAATISFRRALLYSGKSQIELTQPLSDSFFSDFLKLRKGDGVHHLAYTVDDIDAYLSRLKPTSAELVLDAHLPDDGSRVVYIDGFAHGPTIELIQLSPGTNAYE